MRERHRHFNARDAGATVVLDARFLAVAHGDPVSTWTSRSGSNSPTGSSTTRPAFESVSGLNGQPTVKFTAASQHKLVFGSAVLTLSTTIITLYKFNTAATYQIIGQWAAGQTGRLLLSANQSDVGNQSANRHNWFNSTITEGGATGGGLGFLLDINKTSPALITYVQTTGSENTKNFSSGTLRDSGTATAVYTGQNTALGASSAAATGNFQGELARVEVLPLAATDPLRKRLEHAAAYSFKISCN